MARIKKKIYKKKNEIFNYNYFYIRKYSTYITSIISGRLCLKRGL